MFRCFQMFHILSFQCHVLFWHISDGMVAWHVSSRYGMKHDVNTTANASVSGHEGICTEGMARHCLDGVLLLNGRDMLRWQFHRYHMVEVHPGTAVDRYISVFWKARVLFQLFASWGSHKAICEHSWIKSPSSKMLLTISNGIYDNISNLLVSACFLFSTLLFLLFASQKLQPSTPFSEVRASPKPFEFPHVRFVDLDEVLLWKRPQHYLEVLKYVKPLRLKPLESSIVLQRSALHAWSVWDMARFD